MDLATDCRGVKARRALSGHDHHVVTRGIAVEIAAKHLAEHATNSVALHGVADLAAGHEPQARGLIVATVKEDHREVRDVVAAATPLSAKKLRAASHPTGARQPLAGRHRAGDHFW